MLQKPNRPGKQTREPRARTQSYARASRPWRKGHVGAIVIEPALEPLIASLSARAIVRLIWQLRQDHRHRRRLCL
jgi:hypothetical protein